MNRRSAAVAGERGAASGRLRPVSSAASQAAGSFGTSVTSSIPPNRSRLARICPAGTEADRARPHLADHHPHGGRVHELEQVAVGADEAREADRIGRADGDDGVGSADRRDRGGVAARGEQVAHDLLVGLEVEAGVDDRVVGPAAAGVEHLGDAVGRELRPAGGPPDAGEHREGRPGTAMLLRDPVELGAGQRTRRGEAAGRGQARRLVEEPQRGRDRGADRVGVDERDPQAGGGELGREGDGRGGAAGRAGRTPDRGDPPPGRPRRRVGPLDGRRRLLAALEPLEQEADLGVGRQRIRDAERRGVLPIGGAAGEERRPRARGRAPRASSAPSQCRGEAEAMSASASIRSTVASASAAPAGRATTTCPSSSSCGSSRSSTCGARLSTTAVTGAPAG